MICVKVLCRKIAATIISVTIGSKKTLIRIKNIFVSLVIFNEILHVSIPIAAVLTIIEIFLPEKRIGVICVIVPWLRIADIGLMDMRRGKWIFLPEKTIGVVCAKKSCRKIAATRVMEVSHIWEISLPEKVIGATTAKKSSRKIATIFISEIPLSLEFSIPINIFGAKIATTWLTIVNIGTSP